MTSKPTAAPKSGSPSAAARSSANAKSTSVPTSARPAALSPNTTSAAPSSSANQAAPGERGLDRRNDVVDRRSGLERRRDGGDMQTNLERRRGPGRRRTDFMKSAEEGEMSQEQFMFVLAIDVFKRVNDKTFPTWTDVLEVIRKLGYRKTMPSELNLGHKVEDWTERADAPCGVFKPSEE